MRIPELFVNYFRDDTRNSPINLASMRVILAFYVLWRGASIDARDLSEWEVILYPINHLLHPPEGFEWVLILERWVLLIAALAFLFGYRTRISAFVTGLTLAHLTGVMMVLNTSGETQQMAVSAMFILLFGLYAEQDELSVDGFRRTQNKSLDGMNALLKNPVDQDFRMTPLKLSLLSLGILYACAAYIKVQRGGLFGWTAPDNLARYTIYYIDLFAVDLPAGQFLVNSPLLLRLSTWGTLILEGSFILFILAGVTLTPILVLLLGMHVGITVTMGIFFFDTFIFLSLFAAYDRVHAHLTSEREIDLVYDEHCYFCTRTLYLFKLLDVQDRVNWMSQYDAPEEYEQQEGVDFEEEMYVFVDGEPFGGYHAFRQLSKQFPATVPLSWLMALSPVEMIGQRIYKYIAENRDRHFVCSYDPDVQS